MFIIKNDVILTLLWTLSDRVPTLLYVFRFQPRKFADINDLLGIRRRCVPAIRHPCPGGITISSVTRYMHSIEP